MSELLFTLAIWLIIFVIGRISDGKKKRAANSEETKTTPRYTQRRIYHPAPQPITPIYTSSHTPAPPSTPVEPSAFGADDEAMAYFADMPEDEENKVRTPKKLPGTDLSPRQAVIWGEVLRRRF